MMYEAQGCLVSTPANSRLEPAEGPLCGTIGGPATRRGSIAFCWGDLKEG